MRIAFVSERTAFHEATDGRERLHRVASSLAARGHDVVVFCTQWWEGYDEHREKDGVTYRGVTVAPARSSFLLRTPVLLARFRPDVIHALPTPPVQVAAATVAGTLVRAPLVVDWFGDEDLPDDRWTRHAASGPDRVVTPSELVRTAVRERGADEEDTCVIPESIDMSLVEETEPERGADVVYARELDEDANVETLLLALAELRQRDWSATIIGDGPKRDAIEEEAADLRIDDRITFAGDLSRAERVARYKGAHTFVQTAYREQFATELLWALSCGCVGIVEYQTDSSAHELIETYTRSFRVTDDEELADAIVEAGEFERLTVDPDLANYDHDTVLDQYLDCYNGVVEEHGFL